MLIFYSNSKITLIDLNWDQNGTKIRLKEERDFFCFLVIRRKGEKEAVISLEDMTKVTIDRVFMLKRIRAKIEILKRQRTGDPRPLILDFHVKVGFDG